MPRYTVLAPGFMHGRTYAPNSKRSIVHTESPLDPIPSWLKEIREETTEERAARIESEKLQAEIDADKLKQDADLTGDMTFMNQQPPNPDTSIADDVAPAPVVESQSVVETL